MFNRSGAVYDPPLPIKSSASDMGQRIGDSNDPTFGELFQGKLYVVLNRV